MMKTLNPYTIEHNNNSTNTVLETKIKLATVRDSFNYKHKALLLYDAVDENSPYSLNNLRHGIIIDVKA